MGDLLDNFQHMWDGSEEGWWLAHTAESEWRITFHFAPDGPNLQEVVRLREIVDPLRDRPLSEVLAELRGRATWMHPERFSNLGMRFAMEKAQRSGLRVTAEGQDLGQTVPMRGETAVHIDDEALAAEVVARMKAAGVPLRVVVYVD